MRNLKSNDKGGSPASQTRVNRKGNMSLPIETGVATVLAIISVWLYAVFPDFRMGANVSVILSSVAAIGIVAAAMTLVIASGGIDISVGSITGLCGVVVGILTVNRGWGLGQSIAASVIVGGFCGLVNGILIAKFKLPPIIATLAMFSAARAGAYSLSHGESISGLPASMTNFGYGSVLGIPSPAWVMAACLVLMGILVRKTAFGRSVLAFGGNREAAHLSGIKVPNIEMLVYVLSGILAAIAAIVVTSRQATADPNAGKFFELGAITATVVGGTPVIGGRATVLGTALGVLTIGVVQNGVVQYKGDSMWEMLVTAVVLLAAVELDRIRRTRKIK